MNAGPPRLSLHDWSCLRAELVWIYDHAPADKSRHMVADHTRGNWAWFIRRGEVRIRCGAGGVTARAGEWLLLPSECHRQDFSDDAVLISVNFLCQWPSGDNIIASPGPLVLSDRDHPRLRQTAVRLARLVGREFTGPHQLHTRQSAGYPLFLQFQRAFFDWLDAWFQARLAHGAQVTRQAGDPRVLRALRMLDAAPLENGLPKDALSAVGVGPVQLNRLFRSQLKLTPQQYWERRRLESARLLLETGDSPLKEIAAALGFGDTSHFTVWFKRHTRTSPGRYRDQYAGS